MYVLMHECIYTTSENTLLTYISRSISCHCSIVICQRFVSLPLNEFYFIQQDNFQLSNLRMITYKNWSVNTRCTVVISITPLHPALYKTVIERAKILTAVMTTSEHQISDSLTSKVDYSWLYNWNLISMHVQYTLTSLNQIMYWR